MKNKLLLAILTFTFVCFTHSCKEDINVDFNFSPDLPIAGQAVTFTNTSTGGDDWEWLFGDNTFSTSKSPKHTFKKPGTYQVKLRVDGSERFVAIKEVTIYDTIPTIHIMMGNDTVNYVNFLETVTLKALYYNPNDETITYNWKFSQNVTGDSLYSVNYGDGTVGKETKAASFKVLFNKKNVDETIELKLTIGKKDTTITTVVHVHDVKKTSIVYIQKDGSLLRKRILINGDEDSIILIPNLFEDNKQHYPFNLFFKNNLLYVFDTGSKYKNDGSWALDTEGNGSISVINLSTNEKEEMINNKNLSSQFGFYNGYVNNTDVYWSDYANTIYKIGKDARNLTFTENTNVYVSVDKLSEFGSSMKLDQKTGGFSIYENIFYWGKGITGKGIHRFKTADINANPIPTYYNTILSNYQIRTFAIDDINEMIYFSGMSSDGKAGLWVSDINGRNIKQIDNSPMGDFHLYMPNIIIDNDNNRVYWSYISPEDEGIAAPGGVSWDTYYESNPTHQTGIKHIKLRVSISEAIGKVNYFILKAKSYGIALDNIKK